MRERYWILDENNDPVPVEDVVQWAEKFMSQDRQVAKTQLQGAAVSTVFLGLDLNPGDGPPWLYETLVFEDADADFEIASLGPWRASTKEQALEAHRNVVAAVEQELEDYHEHMRKARERSQNTQERGRILKWRKKPK